MIPSHKITPKEQAILISGGFILAGFILHSEKFIFFAMLIASTYLVAWLWQKYALRGLDYRRHFSENRAFVGENITVTFAFSNRKWLPLPRLRIDDFVSSDLHFTDAKPEISHIPALSFIRQYVALSWNERVTRQYHIECKARGMYRFAQIRIETGDPFNLFKVVAEKRQEDRIIIYPEVKPVTGLDLLTKELFGPRVSDRQIFEDPIFMRGVRPYQAQDDLRFVHWKNTARTGGLQTKIFDPSTAPNVVFFANIATFEKHWEGVDPILLERLVSVAASMCAFAVENRWLVGLSANGTVYRSDQPLRVLPSRSPQQLTRLLEALAGINGIASGDFESFLLKNGGRLPWGATVVVITAVVTPALEAVFLRLKSTGRKLVLLSLADTPPHWLRGVLTFHMPGRTVAENYHFSPVSVFDDEIEHEAVQK